MVTGALRWIRKPRLANLHASIPLLQSVSTRARRRLRGRGWSRPRRRVRFRFPSSPCLRERSWFSIHRTTHRWRAVHDSRVGTGVAGPPFAAAHGSPRSIVFIGRQTPDDSLGQNLVDLAVPRYRLRSSGFWAVVDVVPPTVPNQNASHLLQSPDKFESLHAISNSSSFLIPGISSELKVRKRSRR